MAAIRPADCGFTDSGTMATRVTCESRACCVDSKCCNVEARKPSIVNVFSLATRPLAHYPPAAACTTFKGPFTERRPHEIKPRVIAPRPSRKPSADQFTLESVSVELEQIANAGVRAIAKNHREAHPHASLIMS